MEGNGWLLPPQAVQRVVGEERAVKSCEATAGQTGFFGRIELVNPRVLQRFLERLAAQRRHYFVGSFGFGAGARHHHAVPLPGSGGAELAELVGVELGNKQQLLLAVHELVPEKLTDDHHRAGQPILPLLIRQLHDAGRDKGPGLVGSAGEHGIRLGASVIIYQPIS